MAVEAMKPSTWGHIILEIAESETSGAMPATLAQLGYVKEDTMSMETAEGDTLQLFESGHILRDEMKLEPTLTFNATVLQIPEAMKEAFWGLNGTKVKSMINGKKFAIRIKAPEIEGSEAFIAPYCSIAMTPVFAEKEGWSAALTVTIIKGPAEYLFDFEEVVVPAG